jgi:6,7-dimethyl-8-ribityllumazine synthase
MRAPIETERLYGRRAARTVEGSDRHFRRARAGRRGAVTELKAAGVTHEVITVPGALEIPAAIAIALDAAEKNGKPYDAVIALGCVIRGDTIHFEIVSMESSRALMDLAVARRIPLGNGIITVNTDAQAWARARPSELNKGGDAARAALAMLRIKRRLART